MSDISVRIDEQEELDFDISINVSSTNVEEQKEVRVRFIVEDGTINYTFNAREKEEGGYSVRIPVMENKMASGEKDCMLEVICNNRYFPAWKGTVNFEKSIRVEAAIVKNGEDKKPPIQVTSISKTSNTGVVEDVVEVDNKEKISEEKPIEKKDRVYALDPAPENKKTIKEEPTIKRRETKKVSSRVKATYAKIFKNTEKKGYKTLKNEDVSNLTNKKLITSVRDI